MFRFLKRLKFLLTATNQHGVHSPFVFNFITKCIYQKKISNQSKTIDVLLKSIKYFDYKSIQVINNNAIAELINKKIKKHTFDKNDVDLIYTDKITTSLFESFLSIEKTHNNSMLLINDIYGNEDSINRWQQIKKTKRATVTIDFFYCGVVFIRKEQEKEHFKIRL